VFVIRSSYPKLSVNGPTREPSVATFREFELSGMFDVSVKISEPFQLPLCVRYVYCLSPMA
jgi:hypothetical protein